MVKGSASVNRIFPSSRSFWIAGRRVRCPGGKGSAAWSFGSARFPV